MDRKHPHLNPESVPSGDGCVECLASGAWWLHLRRCAQCGHIGCCDSSPGQHARAHAAATGHAVATSFEPGEAWFWDYQRERAVDGVDLPPPHAHPAAQPTPGPAGRVPSDWQARLR